MQRRTFLRLALAAAPALALGCTLVTARRMLFGPAASGVLSGPAFSRILTLIAEHSGGSIEVSGPHMISGDGKTFIVMVGGNDRPNDILIWAWDNEAETLEGPVTLINALSGGSSTSPDSHNAPAIEINADGHLVVAAIAHQATTVRVWVSTNPYDISAWEDPFTWTPISGMLTYPQLSVLSSGRVVLTFRRQSGGNAWLVRCHSDDGGANWFNGTPFFRSGTDNLYSTHACDGERIHFAVTNTFPDAGNYSLSYFALEMVTSGDLEDVDGSVLVADADLPATPADVVELVAAAGGDKFPYSMVINDDGHAVIAWQSKATTPIAFGEIIRAPSAITTTTIGTSELLFGTIQSVGGGCHVSGNPNRYIHGRVQGGVIQVVEWAKSGTWNDGTVIATTTCAPSPFLVKDPDPVGPKVGFFPRDFDDSGNFDPELAAVA